MLPFLIDLEWGSTLIRVPTFGILVALSFLLGYLEALRSAFRQKLPPKHIENLFILFVLSSLIGSRLFHVFFEEWSYFKSNPQAIVAIGEGGFTFYGAMLLALPVFFGYCRLKKIPLGVYFDLLIIPVLLGLFIGRLGCLAAGCCWGKPTDAFWGIVFSNPLALTPYKNIPLHPTQIYESIGALVLLFAAKWYQKQKPIPGMLFATGIFSYACLRFVVEFFRGDDYRGYAFSGHFSYAQIISIILAIISGGLWTFLYRNRNST